MGSGRWAGLTLTTAAVASDATRRRVALAVGRSSRPGTRPRGRVCDREGRRPPRDSPKPPVPPTASARTWVPTQAEQVPRCRSLGPPTSSPLAGPWSEDTLSAPVAMTARFRPQVSAVRALFPTTGRVRSRRPTGRCVVEARRWRRSKNAALWIRLRKAQPVRAAGTAGFRRVRGLGRVGAWRWHLRWGMRRVRGVRGAPGRCTPRSRLRRRERRPRIRRQDALLRDRRAAARVRAGVATDSTGARAMRAKGAVSKAAFGTAWRKGTRRTKAKTTTRRRCSPRSSSLRSRRRGKSAPTSSEKWTSPLAARVPHDRTGRRWEEVEGVEEVVGAGTGFWMTTWRGEATGRGWVVEVPRRARGWGTLWWRWGVIGRERRRARRRRVGRAACTPTADTARRPTVAVECRRPPVARA